MPVVKAIREYLEQGYDDVSVLHLQAWSADHAQLATESYLSSESGLRIRVSLSTGSETQEAPQI